MSAVFVVDERLFTAFTTKEGSFGLANALRKRGMKCLFSFACGGRSFSSFTGIGEMGSGGGVEWIFPLEGMTRLSRFSSSVIRFCSVDKTWLDSSDSASFACV